MRRRSPAIDTHDAPALRLGALRTRVTRAVLAAGALAALAAAAASARGLDTRAPGLLATDAAGVVVLDLSLSIAESDYPRVQRTLERLVAENSSIGLVTFSDVPYELLPPGTPGRELTAMLRMLAKDNPWSDAFSGGTVISAGLELAAGMLERDAVRDGSILLVSDLETAPEDVPQLSRVLRGLDDRGVPVRVVALSPTRESRQLFESLLGADALAEAPPPPAPGERPQSAAAQAALPGGLLVLGAVLFAALAVHERFAARLALGVRA